jgi:hypothetical protein
MAVRVRCECGFVSAINVVMEIAPCHSSLTGMAAAGAVRHDLREEADEEERDDGALCVAPERRPLRQIVTVRLAGALSAAGHQPLHGSDGLSPSLSLATRVSLTRRVGGTPRALAAVATPSGCRPASAGGLVVVAHGPLLSLAVVPPNGGPARASIIASSSLVRMLVTW